MRRSSFWRAAEARLLAKRIDELTRRGPHEFSDVVVLLRATTVVQIASAARARRRMPAKSTFFYPKPRTGLVFRRFSH